MTDRTITSFPRAARRTIQLLGLPMLGLPLLGLASAAVAQDSVQDFRLPPSATTPRAAGPVDSDHPVATPTRAAPDPAPAASPPPLIDIPAPSAARSEPIAPAVSRLQPTPRVMASSPAPVVTPAPTISPLPTAAAPTSPAEPAPVPTAAPEPEPEPVAADQALPWPWIGGGAAVVLLLGGLLAWRRRTGPVEEVAWEESPAAEPAVPQPSPPAALTPPRKLDPPRPAPPPPPPPAPELPPVGERRPLEMQLEARHLSRAMINASLAYRLTLTNCTATPLGPLLISGDFVSAHASLSAQEQLMPGAPLAMLHEVAGLAAGESVSLSGELRLPIASILPIQSGGGARVFVPLARFRAEAEGRPAATRVFVIGQTSDAAEGNLRPFPLDRGPGVDRGLGQRELELPA